MFRLAIAHCVMLVILVILLIDGKELTNAVTEIFESMGYSPVCVASALACKFSSTRTVNVANVAEDKKSNFDSEVRFNTKRPRNCREIQEMGDEDSGVRIVHPFNCCRDREMFVYCDQDTDGGGWTVFQNRDALPLREDFYRTWVEYALGFGNLTGEFWLGLDNIHALVSSTLMEIRIDLEDFNGAQRWVNYGIFFVGDASTKYTLSVGKFSGNTNDGLGYHSGSKFSTHDQDNDGNAKNCAVTYRGAWWYNSCHNSNLNGYQYVGQIKSSADGIIWEEFRGDNYSLKKSSMKFRPVYPSRIFVSNANV